MTRLDEFGMRMQHWRDAEGVVHYWYINDTECALPRETSCGMVLATRTELKAVDADEPWTTSISYDDLFFDGPVTCLECLAEGAHAPC